MNSELRGVYRSVSVKTSAVALFGDPNAKNETESPARWINSLFGHGHNGIGIWQHFELYLRSAAIMYCPVIALGFAHFAHG
jgi:hypothetical protein